MHGKPCTYADGSKNLCMHICTTELAWDLKPCGTSVQMKGWWRKKLFLHRIEMRKCCFGSTNK